MKKIIKTSSSNHLQTSKINIGKHNQYMLPGIYGIVQNTTFYQVDDANAFSLSIFPS